MRVVGTTTVDRPSTVERPGAAGPGSGLGGNWQVIVLNDDHNTFDHVAQTLARIVPGVSLDKGYTIADTIHNSGQAAVWTGPRRQRSITGSNCRTRA